MHLEDLLTAFNVRQAHIYLAVKPARAQQRLIQDIRAVCGRDNDNALVCTEAVHLHQQLVQRLLTLVVSAAQPCAALAAHCVDLINEHDTGRSLFRLIEKVTHTGRAHAHIHLHKVRAGDGIERHARLARTGAGQKCFTSARRAHQQHAVRDARAQRVEFRLIFEELDNLLQLFFFLVCTGHVLKCGLTALLGLVLYLGPAYIHRAAPAGLLVHEIVEACHQQNGDQQHRQHRQPDRRFRGGQQVHLQFRTAIFFGIDFAVALQIILVQQFARIRQRIGEHSLFCRVRSGAR